VDAVANLGVGLTNARHVDMIERRYSEIITDLMLIYCGNR